MADYRLLASRGIWYDMIEQGVKKFDFRSGYREMNAGDHITFVEVDTIGLGGTMTGRECTFRITLVVHSDDFPNDFNWTGGTFTIIQFEPIEDDEK